MKTCNQNLPGHHFSLVPAWQSTPLTEQDPRLGHRNFGIMCAAITPDSRYVLTLNYQDRELIIWDYETGHRVDRGNWGGYDKVHWMYLTPDGACAVVVGETGGVVDLPAADTSRVEAWRKRAKPSGEYITVAENGRWGIFIRGEAQVWDFEHDAPGVILPRPEGSAGSNAYYRQAPVISPDGRYGFCRYGHILVGWDLAEGKIIWQQGASNGIYVPLAICPHPNHLLIGAELSIQCWNWENGLMAGPELMTTGSRVTALAFTPDGRNLISGHNNGRICVWRWPTGQLERNLAGHGSGAIRQLVSASNGDELISAGDDTSLRKWQISSGKQLFSTLSSRGTPAPLSIPPAGGVVITPVGCDRATLAVRDLVTGDIRTQLIGHQGNVNVLVYLKEGQHLLTGSDDHTLRLWDWKNGRCLAVLQGGHAGQILAIKIRPGGKQIVSGAADGSIMEWDLSRAAPIRRLLQFQPPDTRWNNQIILGPDLKWALTSVAVINPAYINYDAYNWYLWNLEAAKEQGHWYGSGAAHTVIGRHFVQVGGLKYDQLEITDLVTTRKQVYQYDCRIDSQWAAFPDQESLYTSRGFIDPDTGRGGGVFAESQGRITAAVVSQDRSLVAICADRQLRLWEVATGRELGAIETDKHLFSLAMDPACSVIIGGDEELQIRGYKIE